MSELSEFLIDREITWRLPCGPVTDGLNDNNDGCNGRCRGHRREQSSAIYYMT